MLNITLRQMRSLIAIRDHGKISSAARALGLTSPAVTIQLKQAEEELGTELFVRTREGTIITRSGQMVIESANRIMNEIELLNERLDDLKGLKTGSIRLGAVSTGKYFAPRMIAAFADLYPGISINLVAANRAEIISRLQSHDIDIALMGRPPKHFGVHATLFGDHPMVYICNPSHPMAERRDIGLNEIARQKFIVRERGSGTRSSFEFLMSNLGGDRELLRTEMDSNETIKQAVMAGLGIAFISGHTIEHEMRAGTLVVMDVEDTPVRRQWYSVRHADRRPTPAMLALDEFLRMRGPSLLPLMTKTYRTGSLTPE